MTTDKKREVATKEIKELIKSLLTLPLLENKKNEIKVDLSKALDEDKVEKLFNNLDTLDTLSNEEYMIVLKRFYAFSGSENLNPEVVGFVKKDFLYNESFKECYMKQTGYGESTINSLKTLFGRTKPMEMNLNKDVYEFTYRELSNLLTSLESKTLRSLQNYISKLKKYIDYAVETGKTDINHIDKFNGQPNLERFLDKEADENRVFSRDAIMSMAMYADNPQDGVILSLIFDGVSFKDEYAELVNLTRQMIDFDLNLINLPAKIEGETIIPERTIEISHETKIMIERAFSVDKYISIKGQKSRTYNIMHSDHVLRGIRKGREKINWRNINQRILRISEINDEENLNATTISYSGQVYHAKELLDSGMEMSEVVDTILTRFGFPINTSSQFYLRTRIEKYLNKNQ